MGTDLENEDVLELDVCVENEIIWNGLSEVMVSYPQTADSEVMVSVVWT